VKVLENYVNKINFLARFGLTRFIPLFAVLYIPTLILTTIIDPLIAVLLSHFLLGSFVTWILFKEEERFENVRDDKLLVVAFGYWMAFLWFNLGIFFAYGVLKMWDRL